MAVAICDDISNGIENNSIPVFNDCDGQIPAEITYVKTSIPGQGSRHEDFEALLEGCAHTDSCRDNNCLCVRTSRGPTYTPDRKLRQELLVAGQTQKPVIECNSRCPCDETSCPNRVAQLGIRVSLSVFKTPDKGWAMRSEEGLLPRGTFVCEYAGEILGYEEALKRTRLRDRLGEMNYLHVLREHVSGGEPVQTYVDPSKMGNVGRYVNHSCEPNLIMVPVRVEHLVPRLCLFASKDIVRGQELTFDYSGGEDGSGENRPASAERKRCRCGSLRCGRWLPCDGTLFEL